LPLLLHERPRKRAQANQHCTSYELVEQWSAIVCAAVRGLRAVVVVGYQ
jgi:hypothetical protein